jgi:hypothetical protein
MMKTCRTAALICVNRRRFGGVWPFFSYPTERAIGPIDRDQCRRPTLWHLLPMALSRRTNDDTRSMRDRFIEVSAEALAALDYEAPRRDAYLEGFAICRALDTLEDLEIVLAIRWGECKRARNRAGDGYLRYFWTTEAIGWVAAYLGRLGPTALGDASTPPRSSKWFVLAGAAPEAFKAAALLLAAAIAGIGGGALASILFG